MSEYFAPNYGASHFHCPYCQVNSKQVWNATAYYPGGIKQNIPNFKLSCCTHCNKLAYWFDEKIIVPNASSAPYPHNDMPKEVQEDYLEARSIVNNSPRGAAALLRLCLQKLMKELGEPGKHIATDIKSLVEKGLPDEVREALDILRVFGNDSVHPGTINLKDDFNTTVQLFDLINFIVEDRITRKKRISALYARIPETKRITVPEDSI